MEKCVASFGNNPFTIAIFSYGVVWQNGAQDKEAVQSVVTTKVKGVSILNSSRQFMVGCKDWPILDHVDLIVPPQVSIINLRVFRFEMPSLRACALK